MRKRAHYLNKTNILERAEHLPLGKFLVFGIKQAWAALFGGLMLGAIVLTAYVDLPWLARYDWLFVFAIAIQLFMLATKLEKPREVITIVLFHLVGLGMELFKTSDHIASWTYPGNALFELGNVPLFSGFMYAAVGSYIARSWRVMHLRFYNYPKRLWTILLASAIYINFFTHHFIFDFRYILFTILIILYGRTTVTYTINTTVRRMPMLVAFVLIALFIWLAENAATFTKVWLYPSQVEAWQIVGLEKIGSWLLLMVISFIMIEVLHHLQLRRAGSSSSS